MKNPETKPERSTGEDERAIPRPAGPVGEFTVAGANQTAAPDKAEGGPPRRDDLTMTPSEMGRRTLEAATETPSRRSKQDDRNESLPETAP